MTNLGSPLALAISPNTPSYVRFSLTIRNTCWMPSEVRLAIPPAGSNFGLLAARTSRVPAANWAGVGAGIRPSDPSYTFELNVPFLTAVLPTPLMFKTRSEPSPASASAEGNHAVGMAPATCHLPPLSPSTAIALFPPHATYSVLPSPEYTRLMGWLPSAASGNVGIFTSKRASVSVSRIEIESPCPLATATVLPPGPAASCEGAMPTVTSRTPPSRLSSTAPGPEVQAPATGSVTIREPDEGATVSLGAGRRPARLETKTDSPATVTPKGAMPTLTSRRD